MQCKNDKIYKTIKDNLNRIYEFIRNIERRNNSSLKL